MNHIYRLIWSPLLNTWVAVAENTCSRGKRTRSAANVLLYASALSCTPAIAAPPASTQLPTGGQVVAGQVAIRQSAATMDITQASQRGVINWDTFNVGAAAQVNFKQPSAASVTLNRIQDSNPSQIYGRISANGQVFLTNPNGVYFSPGSSADVGAMVATTHSISDADFMAGKTTFSRNGATGSVVNEGNLKTALGGYIALLAPEVRNNGVIIAQMGAVVMAAGESISLHFDSNNTLAGITVTPSKIKALVENKQAVIAPGGLIILSAIAANSLQGGVVNNGGRLEATGMMMRGGKILLEASSRIENNGSINADAGIGGSAGSVSLHAPQIVNNGEITTRAIQVSAGTILLDAANITQTVGARMDVSHTTGGVAGTITLAATEDVTLAGSLLASTATDSASNLTGAISIQAAGQVKLENALLDASGGGTIRVAGGTHLPLLPPVNHPNVLFLGNTVLNASGRRGGRVTVSGENIILLDNTRIDASGALGGGSINIGGGWQGSGAIPQATTVSIASTAVLDSSATDTGHGGTVVAWSDVHNVNSETRVYGTLLVVRFNKIITH